MPTPDGLTVTTLHGKFVEPNATGTPLRGTLTFTPFPSTITFPTENVIVTGTETASLDDVTGEFSIDLISTDQAGENPTGWVYSVTEKLVDQKARSYLIALPFTNGEVVELSDVTPTDAAPLYVPVVGPAGAPGVVTTINGHSAATVNLNAADVGALDVATRGAANGVASLDGTTHVPVAQIPDISSTYVTVARIGAANGVAGLGSGGLVPAAQLDLASATPTAIANAGAVGVATKLAREDHTHAGVALTGTQTAAGNKTWSGSAYFTGTEVGVGVTTSLAGVADIRTAAAATTVLNIQNTNGASTATLLKINGDTTTALLLGGFVNGDAQHRIALRGSGQLEFGPGTGARDVNFYRSAAGILNSSGQLASDVSAPAAASHLTRKDYVDGLDGANVKVTGSQTVAGVKTFSSTPVFTPGFTSNGASTVTRSSGTSEALKLTTSVANGLALRTQVTAYATDRAMASGLSGDTVDPFSIWGNGKLEWGPGGSTARDVNLYRGGTNLLKTDDAFSSVGDLTTNGNFSADGIGKVIFLNKSSDTARASSTITDDPHLTVSLTAGAVYELYGVLLAYASVATTDIQFNFTSQASTLGYVNSWGANLGTTSNAATPLQVTTMLAGNATQHYGANTNSASPLGIALMGLVVPGTSGTFALSWARNTGTGTTTLMTNSFIRLTRLA